MLDFTIITKRPEGWSTSLYKTYRKYQNNIIKAYLRRGQRPINSAQLSFLRGHTPRSEQRSIHKLHEQNPVEITQPTIMRSPEGKTSMDKIVKIIAWIIVGSIAIAVIAFHLW